MTSATNAAEAMLTMHEAGAAAAAAVVVGMVSFLSPATVGGFVEALVVNDSVDAVAVSASCFFKMATAFTRKASWVPPATRLVCSVGSEDKS